ncbi:hypothetical protein NQZ79_g1901 [Umbelopsis isabellina]|nr:hypothetical protein NQZ79_g1901 [Umbelopsis isabellina]
MWNLWRDAQDQMSQRQSQARTDDLAESDDDLANLRTRQDEVLDDSQIQDEQIPSVQELLNDIRKNNKSLSDLERMMESIDQNCKIEDITDTLLISDQQADLVAVEELRRKDYLIENYRKRTEDLEQQLADLKAKQISDGNQKVDDELMKQLQVNLSYRDSEIEKLRNQLEVASAENASAVKAIEEKEEQINVLRRLDEGRNKWATGFTRAPESTYSSGEKQDEDDIIDASRRISQLRWEIEQYSNRTSQLEANLEMKQKELLEMKADHDELVASAKLARTMSEGHDSYLDEVKTLKIEVERKDSEIDSKNSEISALMEDIMNLNESGKNSRSEDEIKEMKVLARAKDERITQLDNTVSDLKKKVAGMEREHANERDKFREELTEQKNELEKKEDMLNSAADKVFDLEDMIDSLQDELHALEEERKSTSLGHHDPDNACESCRETIEELRSELITTQQALEEAVELAERQKDRYKEVIAEQAQDLEELQQALDAKEDQENVYNQMPKKPTDTDSKVARLEQEKHDLEERLKERISLLSDKDKDLKQYVRMVESLRQDSES